MIPIPAPAGATPGGDGIALGQGPATVDAYIDFLCPFCRMFEERSGPPLEEMVDRGLITLVYHPLGFLDRLSTTAYSTRAAAASGCAADGGRFLPYLHALYDFQPPEGGPGLSDAQLVALGQRVGLADPAFAEGVMTGRYLPWAAFVTEQALQRGVSGTPSTFVDGAPVPANADAIAAAVASHVGA
jgi:protein-disulfide isomerase